MDAKTITLASLLAATSAGLIYQMGDGGKYEQVTLAEEPTTDAILLAATPEIRDAVAAVGPGVTCAPCESGVWDGSKRVLTAGWCCGGAFMPRAIADGLDAAEALARNPPAEAVEP